MTHDIVDVHRMWFSRTPNCSPHIRGRWIGEVKRIMSNLKFFLFGLCVCRRRVKSRSFVKVHESNYCLSIASHNEKGKNLRFKMILEKKKAQIWDCTFTLSPPHRKKYRLRIILLSPPPTTRRPRCPPPPPSQVRWAKREIELQRSPDTVTTAFLVSLPHT